MIRGVGRGFISGWWGVVMIILALLTILVCWCCWCYGLLEKRRRRLSLAQHADSDLTLREDSPKFLKLLANRENVRRLSNISIQPEGAVKNCIVEYSGSVCPFQSATHNTNCMSMTIPTTIHLPNLDD